ncbi:unnamed protein product [Boreogadus saida]
MQQHLLLLIELIRITLTLESSTLERSSTLESSRSSTLESSTLERSSTLESSTQPLSHRSQKASHKMNPSTLPYK